MDKIREFLSVSYGCGGSGYGYGTGYNDGSGYGYGNGYSDGSSDGDGSGYGFGYGSSDGDGSGYGFGYGRKSINGEVVYIIDDIPTIIRQIHGNIAKGCILNSDLTLTQCYVIKQNNLFAHGETLHKAREALLEKLFEDMPEEERIDEFVKAHEPNVKYSDKDFFDWHHRLTGSCEMGRMAFAKDHGLEDLTGSRTVKEFIELCENSYGGETIKQLKEFYE